MKFQNHVIWSRNHVSGHEFTGILLNCLRCRAMCKTTDCYLFSGATKKARRVARAVTRLTVYRPLQYRTGLSWMASRPVHDIFTGRRHVFQKIIILGKILLLTVTVIFKKFLKILLKILKIMK